MARAVWSGAISFGLVNIPSKLFVATDSKDLSFKTLHATCKTPLTRPYVCPSCNTSVKQDEMLKAYEYGKGNYIPITEEELESAAAESGKAIHVLGFVEEKDIGPLHYEKSYYLGPEETSVKPFELLRQALLRTGKVAVAQATLWRKEQLVALRVVGGALVMSLLFYQDEIKEAPEVPVTKPVVLAEEELDLAMRLVTELTVEFDPGKYKDRYREALLSLIEAKVEGKAFELPSVPAASATQDLMTALKASLEQVKKA